MPSPLERKLFKQSTVYPVAEDPPATYEDGVSLGPLRDGPPLTPEEYLRRNEQEMTPASLKAAERSVYTTPNPRGIDTKINQGIETLVENAGVLKEYADRRIDRTIDKLTEIKQQKEKAETKPDTRFDEPGTNIRYAETKPKIGSAIDNVARDVSTAAIEPTMDLSLHKEDTKNLRDFAKDLGVDLKDPYDTWAYIRDMSAGLLASDDSTYLGALGDAALLSNKNRRIANAAHKELKAKLALAQWKNQEDWAKLKYKTAAAFQTALAKNAGGAGFKKQPAGAYSDIGLNGEKIQWSPIEMTPEGVNAVQTMPNTMWQYHGNQLYVKDLDQKTYDQLIANRDRIEKAYDGVVTRWFGKPETMRAEIDNQFFQTTAGGEYLLSVRDDPAMQKIVSNLMEQHVEGIEEFADTYLGEAKPDGAEVARMLVQFPQIIQGLTRSMTEGPASNLPEADYKEISNRIEQLTKQGLGDAAIDNQFKPIDNSLVFQNALKNAVQDIKWDAPNRKFKYAWGVSLTDLEEIQDASEDVRGIGWFNLAEAPETYQKQVDMFYRSDEMPPFNRDQIENLPPEQRDDVYIDMAKIQRHMLRHGLDRDRIKWDINLSYDDSGLVFGGEDRFNLFGIQKDVDARYEQPSNMYLEPLYFTKNGNQYSTEVLRDQGIFFNVFKGSYFEYDENGNRHDIFPEQQPGIKIGKPKSVKL
jgi:hypothetical protein